jgi:uncharacterized protein YbjT (DUF2867 family)
MILVTGASGLSGSAVVREFSRRNVPLRALVRDLKRAGDLARLPGVEVVEGDMGEPHTLIRALDGVDRALMISTSLPDMVQTQSRFIETCRVVGVTHVVKLSGKESGDGFNPAMFRFTRMHEQIERYLETSGLAWTHLRPSQFMQTYLREAGSITGQGALFLPFEGIRLAPIDVEDIAKIAVGVLLGDGHAGRSYDMTGPEALTMAEIAEHISQAIDAPVRFVPVTPQERRRRLLEAGLPSYLVDAMDEQTAERLRRPDSPVYISTHERFGVRPTPFAEFAVRNAKAFLSERVAAMS